MNMPLVGEAPLPIPSAQISSLTAHLCQAARENDQQWVEELLAAGAQINGRCVYGDKAFSPVSRRTKVAKTLITPLACAAEAANVGMVAFLLEHGAAVEVARIDQCPGPLHYAAMTSPSPDIVQMLHEQGAKVDVTCTWGDTADVTPLHLAASNSVAKALISAGADVFATDANGQTPLFWAVKAHSRGASLDSLAVISANLENGSPVNLRDNEGNTVLDILQKSQANDSAPVDDVVAVLERYGAQSLSDSCAALPGDRVGDVTNLRAVLKCCWTRYTAGSTPWAWCLALFICLLVCLLASSSFSRLSSPYLMAWHAFRLSY
jgi:ankyrin repeat protein